MVQIGEIIRGRSDLSAFVVHFTRGEDPEANIKDMLNQRQIDARNRHGWHLGAVGAAGLKAVCFTETPLEFLSSMCGPIQGRNVQLSEWGLGFGKYTARLLGANPVMYVHGFPNKGGGANQPANALNRLRVAVEGHHSGVAPLPPAVAAASATILAFASRMQRAGGPNEWWWEREWRCVGDFRFTYPDVAFGLAPRDRVEDMEAWVLTETGHPMRFLSPSWTIEEAIGHLAGVPADDLPWPRPRY